MRLKTLALVIIPTIFYMANPPLSAETPNVLEAKLRFDADHVKAQDVLHMTVSLHNKSAKESSVEVLVPYVAYPDIRNVRTGKQASWWAPASDGPVMPKTIVLKPDQEYPLVTYSLKIIDEKVEGKGAKELGDLLRPADWSPSAGLPRNSGLMTAIPDSYSAKFRLTLGSVVVETAPKAFRIVK